MRYIWNYLERKDWKASTKYNVALLICGIMAAVIGYVVWLVVRNWYFNSVDWMLCFIGYPMVLTWLLVILYAYNNSFHSGNKKTEL